MRKSIIFLMVCAGLVVVTACSSVKNFFTPGAFDAKDLVAQFDTAYVPDAGGHLRTDGYYYWRNGPGYYAFAFLPDGTFMFLLFKDDCMDSIGRPTQNLDKLIANDNRYKYTYAGGIYKVKNDSVFINSYEVYNIGYMLRSFELEVVNRDTLSGVVKFYDGMPSERPSHTYTFVDASPLPECYRSYYKSRSWTWRKRGMWKDYMREVEAQ